MEEESNKAQLKPTKSIFSVRAFICKRILKHRPGYELLLFASVGIISFR